MYPSAGRALHTLGRKVWGGGTCPQCPPRFRRLCTCTWTVVIGTTLVSSQSPPPPPPSPSAVGSSTDTCIQKGAQKSSENDHNNVIEFENGRGRSPDPQNTCAWSYRPIVLKGYCVKFLFLWIGSSLIIQCYLPQIIFNNVNKQLNKQ